MHHRNSMLIPSHQMMPIGQEVVPSQQQMFSQYIQQHPQMLRHSSTQHNLF
jgi:hypothetical protein